ncbi:amidohydrolase family protein [Microbacterium sp. NPDC058342]|uniref:amidohydrolase family protein n=1 Tax=Microbacterium sp. NPDC058342 TaxID=3346454 RepID=UPI0036485C7F
MIIDIHGHYTTAPPPLGAWRDLQISFTRGEGPAPGPSSLRISDDDIRETIESNQLRLMNDRSSDVTVFSPRASFMAHHIGDFSASETWARLCNDLVARVAGLFPDRFLMGAMLPQSPGVDPATTIPELTRAVEELGAVTVNLNPDPSGGAWSAPTLTDRSWYPIYEKLVEYEIPAMVHVSTTCRPDVFHTTGDHYVNADTTAFMQLVRGDLFRDFPDLKLVIPHGGGAVPYHWGRFRGLAMALGKPELEEHLLNNVYFDTCVYHQAGIDLLADVIPTKNILFASEMIGAVRDVDPRTGHYFDDTKRYVDATPHLSSAERELVFEGNVRRVYPRLDRALAARGL